MSSDDYGRAFRKEVRERLWGITPGPWYVDDKEMTVRAETYNGEILFDRSGEGRSYWRESGKPNAGFIANAPDDLKKLLDLADTLEDLAKEWDDMARGMTQFDAALRVCALKLRQALEALDSE